jgi:hypothetical protein
MPRRYTPEERVAHFWEKVDRAGACWIWTGSLSVRGYGQVRQPGTRILARAHVVAYALAKGPVPKGAVLHHTCGEKRCVNPDHLEPITQRQHTREHPENVATRKARQTHCEHGHAFTPENIYWTRRGHRQCRECTLSRQRAAYRRARTEREETS